MVRNAAGVADRVAPFRPFWWRERQRLVEHGVEHVDKRHLGNQAGIEIRSHISDRSDQCAAGGSAMRDDLAPRTPALFDQILAHRDEIAERVRFLRQLAFAIPAPALLAAATHMGDSVDEAAIDEREPIGIEGCRDRNAVRAVAIKKAGRGATERKILAVKERDRNGLAVRRRRE